MVSKPREWNETCLRLTVVAAVMNKYIRRTSERGRTNSLTGSPSPGRGQRSRGGEEARWREQKRKSGTDKKKGRESENGTHGAWSLCPVSRHDVPEVLLLGGEQSAADENDQ